MSSLKEILKNVVSSCETLEPGEYSVSPNPRVSGVNYIGVPKTNTWYHIDTLEKVRAAAKANGLKIRVLFRGPRKNGWTVSTTLKKDAVYFVPYVYGKTK